jgi:hypothetical protein
MTHLFAHVNMMEQRRTHSAHIRTRMHASAYACMGPHIHVHFCLLDIIFHREILPRIQFRCTIYTHACMYTAVHAHASFVSCIFTPASVASTCVKKKKARQKMKLCPRKLEHTLIFEHACVHLHMHVRIKQLMCMFHEKKSNKALGHVIICACMFLSYLGMWCVYKARMYSNHYACMHTSTNVCVHIHKLTCVWSQ